MNIDQAAINISGVLQDSRIGTLKGPLTSREHQQLAADLHLLISRAQSADKLSDEQNRYAIAMSYLVEFYHGNVVNQDDLAGFLNIPDTPKEINEAPDNGRLS